VLTIESGMRANTAISQESETRHPSRDLALEYARLLQEQEDWQEQRTAAEGALGLGTALLVSAGGWWMLALAVARALW